MEFSLGTLEESILLLVVVAEEDAYAYALVKAYEEHMNKKLSLSAVHAVLTRLEKKGFVNSTLHQAGEERGGRKKRVFNITNTGKRAIEEIKNNRLRLWNLVPQSF